MIEHQADADWGRLELLDTDVTDYSRKYNNRLFELHQEHIEGMVLDVGAGGDDSNRYEDLAPEAIKYIAVDIADTNGVNIRGDARQLPVETESVDTVVVSAMLYQMPLHEVDDILREIRRVLKPDGTCLGWVPFVYQLHSQPRDYFRPSQFGLETAFATAGFQDTKVYACGYFHQVLLQVIHGEYVRVCEVLGLPQSTFLAISLPVVVMARFVDSLARNLGIRRPWRWNWPVGCFVKAHPEAIDSSKDV